MKMFCISDNIDTALGLKLTGAESVVVQTKEEIDYQIEKILKDENIGILIFTDKIYNMAQNEFDEIREKYKLPLLVKL